MRFFYSIISLLIGLTALSACQKSKPRFVVGVSQCSVDVWRDHLNEELRLATYYYDDIDLRFASAGDDDQKQIEQIDAFVEEGVDLLIVSPNQLRTISPAIHRAYDRGIPVILFDRKTDSPKYTAFIGADNYAIGHTMGEFIAKQLGGRGVVVELQGLATSSPAIERHRGFVDALQAYPQLRLVASVSTDWTEESGRAKMDSLLTKLPSVDYVFGQNDRIAIGARKAMERARRAKGVRFVGVDALPTHGGGLELVRDGRLEASYIYPTRGDLVMRLAHSLLVDAPFERDNYLESALVTSNNAATLLMQHDELQQQRAQLEAIHQQVDHYFTQYRSQQVYLVLLLLIFALLLGLLFWGYRYFTLRRKLDRATTQAKLRYFTRVSQEFRDPLTLIVNPVDELMTDERLDKKQRGLLSIISQQTQLLLRLIGRVEHIEREQLNMEDAEVEQPLPPTPAQQEVVSNPVTPPNAASHLRRLTGESPTEPRKRVLLAEPNAEMRQYMLDILGDSYELRLASNGREALTEVERRRPDLIITAIDLPEIDGLTLCRRLKSEPSTTHLPVVLLTSQSLDAQRAEGYESGADAYLTKPFSPKVVRSRLQNLLESRQKLLERSVQEAVSSAPLPDDADTRFLDAFHQLLQQRMGEVSLTVEQLAADMGMSRVQLFRRVKALTGVNTAELLRATRLRRAHQLLRQGGRTVAEVAYEVGFSSPSYFARCYKAEYGHAPHAQP